MGPTVTADLERRQLELAYELRDRLLERWARVRARAAAAALDASPTPELNCLGSAVEGDAVILRISSERAAELLAGELPELLGERRARMRAVALRRVEVRCHEGEGDYRTTIDVPGGADVGSN